MCGIAGIMSLDGRAPDVVSLKRLGEALAHRGPDGRGRHMEDGVGLIHTRLAIIDLKTGDQPFLAHAADGSQVSLIANGEIYNYLELWDALPEVRFRTRSDCEPPLHLYLRHGLEFTRHLRGMYAIAIYDSGKGKLVLARDPFGIKPLYYAETEMGFVFASEPRAMIRAGLVDARLDEAKRGELLQLQFTTGAETAFAGIRRVLPGEILEITAGRITGRRRTAALPEDGPAAISASGALDELDVRLDDAVAMHQRSDVPYGLFLSGGVDSSVLLAKMSEINQWPVTAFTAGFSGTIVHDERDHARTVARAAGADHQEIEFGEGDFWSLLPEITVAMDDPAADYAVLPSWKLAAAARRLDLKVVLSGEGGDEIFAGYSRYRGAMRPWPLRRALRRRGIFAGLGVLRDPPQNWRNGIAAAGDSAPPRWTRLMGAQAIDCADWLPHDLLSKLDRCLMAHGVEGRVPFLDPKLSAFAFRLPDELKVRGKQGKWLLRSWLDTALPEAQPFARKRGFTVPVGEWISARGRELGPLVAAQPGIQEICHPGAAEGLFRTSGKKAGKAAWTLLFYALWHRTHIQGLDPAGDVFETLSQGA